MAGWLDGAALIRPSSAVGVPGFEREIAPDLRHMRRPSTASNPSVLINRLTASERVALALDLGARDLDAYSRLRGLPPADARLELERRRQARRMRSPAIEALLA